VNRGSSVLLNRPEQRWVVVHDKSLLDQEMRPSIDLVHGALVNYR